MTKDKAIPRRKDDQEVVDNKILVYTASVMFLDEYCLRVTKENLHTLASLASQEKFERRQREVCSLNTLVLQELMAMRIRQIDKYIAVLIGCEVCICQTERQNIPKVVEGNAKFTVKDVRNSNTTLRIPWEKHSIKMGDGIFHFSTRDINIAADLAVTTPGGRTLKEEIQYFVQKKSGSFNAETAVMYGSTELAQNVSGH
jgi:hypothetical protein